MRYPIGDIRETPSSSPPVAEVFLNKDVAVDGWAGDLLGPSGFAYKDGYLYVGYRTSSVIARFQISDSVEQVTGELVADFSKVEGKVDIIDMAFDLKGFLLVSTASMGGVWGVAPDPEQPFQPLNRTPNAIDLRALTGNEKTKCSNIAVDSHGRVYICSNNHDSEQIAPSIVGTIYRAVMNKIA